MPLHTTNRTGEPLVTHERAADVAVLRLNQPERRNAIRVTMVEAIVAAVADPVVRTHRRW